MSSRHEPSGNPLLPAALDLYQRSWQRCWRLALAGALAGALVGLYAALRIQQLMASGGALINSALNGSQDVSGLAMFSVSTLATLLTRLQSLAAATLRSPAVWLSYLGAALITLACHGLLIHQQSMLEAESHQSSIMRRPALALLPGMSLAALLLVLGNALASYVADELMAHEELGALLLLLVLVAWLWGRLQLWLAAMFSEDLGAIDALKRSWQAVRGHWWYASAATTLPYLLIWIASSLVWLMCSRAGLPAGTATVMLTQGAQAAVALFALPLLPAWWLVLYQQLQRMAPR